MLTCVLRSSVRVRLAGLPDRKRLKCGFGIRCVSMRAVIKKHRYTVH